MKKTFAFITSILCLAEIHAQAVASAGPTEKKPIVCSFDRDAPAVILLDEGSADCNSRNELEEVRHRKIQILTEKGKDEANMSIPFYSEDHYETIEKLEAKTINTDQYGVQTEQRVAAASFFTTRVNKYSSNITFTFPNVSVGSILEYSYISVKRSAGGLKYWSFQHRLPVYKSSFKFHPAAWVEFTYAVQKNPAYNIIIDQPKIDKSQIYFEMDSIPGLSDEPYMDSREDYIQQVRFTVTKYVNDFGVNKYMSSWDEVAKELWTSGDFGGEIRANLKEAGSVAALASAGRSDFEKMKAIYQLVGNTVKWNGMTSFAAEEGVRNAWNKKTGNSGCINLLLVNLLRDAGLDTYPLLVSERSNGKINAATPFLSQFNTVYAMVRIGDKTYYLDATYPATPPQLVPPSILNTSALVIDRTRGHIINIDGNENNFWQRITFYGNLDSTGVLCGAVSRSNRGYARMKTMIASQQKQADYIEENIKGGLTNVTIDSLQFEGADNDTVNLTEHFHFQTTMQQTGDYTFIPINFFTGFEKNPFILKDRFSDINFGYQKSIFLNFVITVPDGWNPDAMPKNIRMMNADHSVVFSREIYFEKAESKLTARVHIDLNKSRYPVEEYPAVSEFFKKMTALLNEQVVFKVD